MISAAWKQICKNSAKTASESLIISMVPNVCTGLLHRPVNVCGREVGVAGDAEKPQEVCHINVMIGRRADYT